MGDLLDDPRTRAVLERFLPGSVNIALPDIARGMALRTCLAYARKTTPEAVLEALTQALAALV